MSSVACHIISWFEAQTTQYRSHPAARTQAQHIVHKNTKHKIHTHQNSEVVIVWPSWLQAPEGSAAYSAQTHITITPWMLCSYKDSHICPAWGRELTMQSWPKPDLFLFAVAGRAFCHREQVHPQSLPGQLALRGLEHDQKLWEQTVCLGQRFAAEAEHKNAAELAASVGAVEWLGLG